VEVMTTKASRQQARPMAQGKGNGKPAYFGTSGFQNCSRPRHLAAGTQRLVGSEALRLCQLTLGHFLELTDSLLNDF
jgi:hypothetical protein